MKGRKILALLLAVAMTATVFVGCGKEEKKESTVTSESKTSDSKTSETTKVEESTAPTEEAKEDSLLITEEPLELDLFYTASAVNDDGQYDVFKEAARMTNVMANVSLSKSTTNFDEAFNLMIAGGEISDIVQTYDAVSFSGYGMEGAFVQLDQYMDEYMPNIKAYLEENPEVARRITASDGHIYYIPFIPGGVVSKGWNIRQDWLEALDLEVPETVEELYEVLVAFRDKDPNGNGVADEVPYFDGTKKANELLPLWGARSGWYVENDEVKYGPYEAAYKEAMTNIAKWYDEKLIDQEIFTRGGTARQTLFGENQGGLTHDWFTSTSKFNDTLKDTVEGFKVWPMAPIGGVEVASRPVSDTYGWGVGATSEQIEEACQYLDFWFTEEGIILSNYGIEGVHYDMVDGVPTFKKELVETGTFQSLLVQSGAQHDYGHIQDFEYEKQWMNDAARAGQEMYLEGNYIETPFPLVSMVYTEEEVKEYAALNTQITTFVDENAQKWVLGVEDVEATYEEFIKGLESLGMKELIELQQTAYDRYMGK